MKLLTDRQVAAYSALAAAVVEAFTCVLRFGFALESTRDTASTIGVLTFGIRIHHGYVGIVALLAASALWRRSPPLARWIFVAGAALVLSDLVHHFLVLWPVTGHHEFHLVYPA